MTAFISWYLLLILLGWLTFPLAYRLFPALTDRGFTLARTAGLLIWGYIFWLSTSLGISQNDTGGILLALAILIGLSIWSLITNYELVTTWLKANYSLILTTEILFLTSFAFLAFVRAANPEIVGTEKPMELAFINAILRSPTFPPHDPWLSGYAISYYHFGYILAAMLGKVTSVPGTMVFNLMLALVFALAAVNAYGIIYNLLFINNHQHLHRTQVQVSEIENRKSSIVNRQSLLAPLFLLLVSNIEGFLEFIHRHNVFWTAQSLFWSWLKQIDEFMTVRVGWPNPIWKPDVTTHNFWTWLDVRDLTSAPVQPFGWAPDSVRYLWWWRASRVVQDYDLADNWQEIIDEFPFFSFLLGDLHPHVLAIPFGLLAVAVALNLFLGASRGSIDLFGARLHISPLDFSFAALVLGGLAFLNTWDILVGAALIVFAYILFRVREEGWGWERLEDLILFSLPLAIIAVVLYLPFYFGFSSQAGGLLPNLINPTRGAHLWVMFAPLFIPIFVYLYWPGDKPKPNWLTSVWIVLGLALLLWGSTWIGSLLFRFRDPAFITQYLQSQGVESLGEFFTAASLRRLENIGSLLTLLAILIPAVAYLIGSNQQLEIVNHEVPEGGKSLIVNRFVFLLITLGALLILGPEFLFLRDQFGWRLNTIFKFYYQAWILLSLAAAFGAATLLQTLRGAADILYRVVFGIVLIMALTYPALSLLTKTNNFNPYFGYTLDDFDRVRRENADEAAALEWLKSAPPGVIAEAIGGSYSGYARISTYSGLPTVLGWPGHESQWRGGQGPQGTRQEDIIQLYSTSDWFAANEIIQKYSIRYIYIGTLERSTMRVQEEKFKTHLKVAYQNVSVVVYEAP